jgi:hypothetical protein
MTQQRKERSRTKRAMPMQMPTKRLVCSLIVLGAPHERGAAGTEERTDTAGRAGEKGSQGDERE